MHTLKKLALILSAVFLGLATEAGEGSQQLALYAHLTGRTLLCPGSLPAKLGSFTTPVSDTNAVLALMDAQFKKLNMRVIPDGQKFLRILPEDWQDSPLARQLDRVGGLVPASDPAETAPGGTVSFENVQWDQFLAIYSAVRQRTVLRSGNLADDAGIYFRTSTPLNRAEIVYALNVLAVLNGVAVIDDGEKFVQVVPLAQADQVKALAPPAAAGAILITPKQVQTALSESIPTATGLPLPRPNTNGSPSVLTADKLAAYYAELIHGKSIPAVCGSRYISFKTQTPLTQPEMLYAITTTLALNHLKIVSRDTNSLTLEILPRTP